MSWFKKIQIKTTEYDLVAGSKRVIKDPNNPNQQHFYGSDVWTDALEKWGDALPKNFVVYGELVGFTKDGSAIQKGHTYEAEPGDMNLYVYRVAVVTEGGSLVDLSWNQVREFCAQHGLNTVPELGRYTKRLLDLSIFEEVNFREDWIAANLEGVHVYTDQPVRLSPGGTGVDEGIALRVETGLVPEFFKFKNPSHYLYETEQLDSGESDLESSG